MRDGRGLKAVEFVEGIVDGGIGDEVIDSFCVFILRICESAVFVDEGRGAGKGVVDGADEFGVGEGFATELLGVFQWRNISGHKSK